MKVFSPKKKVIKSQSLEEEIEYQEIEDPMFKSRNKVKLVNPSDLRYKAWREEEIDEELEITTSEL